MYRDEPVSVSGVETRRTPPLFGIGLLENSDVLTASTGARRRFFGVLGERETLRGAVEHAAMAELGLMTPEACKQRLQQGGRGCLPDISEQELSDLVHYIRYLAAPPRLYVDASARRLREEQFNRIGCASCHVPSFSTLKSTFPRLRGGRVDGYTDFLVHDVGGAYKVRTTALWGLNSYGPPYWHDGSAQSINEAVRRHGGEALTARQAYEELSSQAREALLQFLRGL